MDYYADDSGRQTRAMTLTADNVTVVSVWVNAMVVEEIDPFDDKQKFPALNVQCGDTVKRASLGDVVIKHFDDTFDVMKPIEFMHSYTRLEG